VSDGTARRALVTGATGDLGAAICRRLAADGFEVIVHYRSQPETAEALCAEIAAAGGRAAPVRFDVTDPSGAQETLEKLLEGGPIQAVVSNAGITADVVFAGMSEEQWRAPIDVSLHGFYTVLRPLMMPMIRTRWGRIVAVSSVAGLMGNRGQAAYAAAKAGLHGAVKSVALEVATRGITANAVAPGVIESRSVREAFPPERIEALVPMKRAGRPEEVADVIGFLCSDQASYVTGQILSVNGGIC
jgi:3-oxoacyl-[acyl-carrier protein] reductase